MKLVIEIPEEVYKKQRYSQYFGAWSVVLQKCFENGTPLPKGHGRLIDSGGLIKAIEEKAKRLGNADTINGLCGAVALIFDAPTIIEAESEGDDECD